MFLENFQHYRLDFLKHSGKANICRMSTVNRTFMIIAQKIFSFDKIKIFDSLILQLFKLNAYLFILLSYSFTNFLIPETTFPNKALQDRKSTRLNSSH